MSSRDELSDDSSAARPLAAASDSHSAVQVEQGELELESVSLSPNSGAPSSDQPRDGKDVHSQVVQSSDERTFTVDEAIEQLGFGKFQLRLSVMCGFCFCVDALEVMLLSFLLPVLKDEWDLDAGVDGTIGAVVFTGMFIGAYLWGIVADKLGRRRGYIAVAAFVLVFGLLSGVSPNLAALLVFRFLVGVGIGGAPVAFSLFSEFLPTERRGLALMLQQTFWTVGVFIECGIAWIVMPRQGWRWLLVWSTLPTLLIFAFYPWLPESPRFLIVNGRTEEALAVLQRVAEENGKEMLKGRLVLSHNPNVHKQVRQREPVLKMVARTLGVLFQPSLRAVTIKLWIIWFVDTYAYYLIAFITPKFFEGRSVYMLALITSISELPGALIPGLYMIDRFGRKMTLLVCMWGCALGTVLLLVRWGVVFDTMALFLARMFIFGAFAVTYVYTPEAYPTSVRTTGTGAASSMSRIAGIISSFTAEDAPIFDALLSSALLCLVACAAVLSLKVETAGRSLRDYVARTKRRDSVDGAEFAELRDGDEA